MTTKTKRPNKVYLHRSDNGRDWRWSLIGRNRRTISESFGSFSNRADMLHNLALVHGRELAAGDTVINGRQHNAWRWDLDAALEAVGLQPYAETYGDPS